MSAIRKMTDWGELVGMIEKELSTSSEMVSEVTLLKIAELARLFSVEIEFISPQIIMDTLEIKHQISRFGFRELEQVVFDLFAPCFAEAKKENLTKIKLDVKTDGSIILRR